MGNLDTHCLLGNPFTFCKTMTKMSFLPMFLLLSLALSLATAEVEVCGPDHCEQTCGTGQKCNKIKKIACEEDPSKGKNDECCKSFSCSGKIVNNVQGGKTKGVPGAGSSLAGLTGVVLMLSAWAVVMG